PGYDARSIGRDLRASWTSGFGGCARSADLGEVLDPHAGERVVRPLEAAQLDLIVARSVGRDLERTLQALGVRPEALRGVVAGLPRGDQERPVARLEQQQLAEGVIRGALAERVTRRIVREGADA